MSKELATVDSYSRASLEEKREYAAVIAQAGELLPQSLWAPVRMHDGSVRNMPSAGKVMLLAETGAMLGIHPIAALQGVHIIEGKPTLSANLLAGLVRRAGHKLRITSRGSWKDRTYVAIAELIRADDPDFTYRVEWGYERAERAGLLNKKGPWNNFPEAMSKARAITEVIREGAQDVTMVPAYTAEEMDRDGKLEINEDGDVLTQVNHDTPPTYVHEAPPQTAPQGRDAAWWGQTLSRIDNAANKDELTGVWADLTREDKNLMLPDGSMLLGAYFTRRAEVLDQVVEATIEPEEAPPAEASAEPEDTVDAEEVVDEAVDADPATGEVHEPVTEWPVAPIPGSEAAQ